MKNLGKDPQTRRRAVPVKKERVWAPFTDKGSHLSFSRRWDKRESFYNHGYRLPGEHYHKTEKELHDCPWQPGDAAP